MAVVAEHQLESTLRPSSCSVEVESLTTTGSDGISTDEWHVTTDDAEVQFWRHQAEEKESMMKKYEAEAVELRQMVLEKDQQLDAVEKAMTKAMQERLETLAHRQEGVRKLLKQAAKNAEEKALQEEDLRMRWKDKAEAEKELRVQYQQKTTEAESNLDTWRDKADQRSELFEEEAKRRQQAEEELTELKRKFADVKNGHDKAEQQAQHWKNKFEREEKMRKSLEKLQETSGRLSLETPRSQPAPSEVAEEEAHVQQAEARAGEVRAKEMQDEAALAWAHRCSCIGLRRYYVTYKFSGIYAARRSYSELVSADLRFEGMDDPHFRYPFKLTLCPGGDATHKGAVGLFLALLPGPSDEPLTWPVPHDKVKIALRILPDFSSGGNKKVHKPREYVLDGATSKDFRELLAEQSPPEKDNRTSRGCPSLLKKAEFEEGGWTSGPDADEMVVQAELILK